MTRNPQLSRIFFVLALSLTACSRAPSTSPVSLPTINPPSTTNKTALALYAQLPLYADAAKIPWAPIQAATPMRQGSHYAEVPQIRTRLIALHDLSDNIASKSTLYDAALARGIVQFQLTNDLSATGRM